jgi:hypothetical protein
VSQPSNSVSEPDGAPALESATQPEMPPVVPRHRLEQAPLPAMEADGVAVVTLGTVVFAVATLVLGIAYESLQTAGRAWWLWVGVAGTALGLVGIAYCRHLRRLRSASDS